MTAIVHSGGTLTPTLAAETDLVTITAAGTYQLVVDTANLANGETVTLKIYGKAQTTDTERLIHSIPFIHAQGDPLKQSIPIVSPHHFRATLTQANAGSARAFPWAVYAL